MYQQGFRRVIVFYNFHTRNLPKFQSLFMKYLAMDTWMSNKNKPYRRHSSICLSFNFFPKATIFHYKKNRSLNERKNKNRKLWQNMLREEFFLWHQLQLFRTCHTMAFSLAKTTITQNLIIQKYFWKKASLNIICWKQNIIEMLVSKIIDNLRNNPLTIFFPDDAPIIPRVNYSFHQCYFHWKTVIPSILNKNNFDQQNNFDQ